MNNLQITVNWKILDRRRTVAPARAQGRREI